MVARGLMLVALVACAAGGELALAVPIAEDYASNAAYDDGWAVGDNGGTGFGAWSTINNQSGSGSGGGFLASGNSESQIGTGGSFDSFGIFGHSGGVGQAIRPLSMGLSPGQSFQLDMDNGLVDGGGTVGFALRNASAENLFEFFFIGNQTTYRTNSAAGSQATSVGWTNLGLRLTLTLTDTDSFSFDIDQLSDGVGTNITTVTGNLMNPAGGQVISQLRLFNANAGQDNTHNVFFNSFVVTAVPESSAFLFAGAALAASAVGWKRRRRVVAAS